MSETNNTTNQILKFFFDRHILAWRQNNGIIPLPRGGYKSSMRKGLPDIFAITPPNGRIIPIEVKTGPDKLSASQISFLSSCDEAGSTPLIVKDYEDFLNQINVHYGIR